MKKLFQSLQFQARIIVLLLTVSGFIFLYLLISESRKARTLTFHLARISEINSLLENWTNSISDAARSRIRYISLKGKNDLDKWQVADSISLSIFSKFENLIGEQDYYHKKDWQPISSMYKEIHEDLALKINGKDENGFENKSGNQNGNQSGIQKLSSGDLKMIREKEGVLHDNIVYYQFKLGESRSNTLKLFDRHMKAMEIKVVSSLFALVIVFFLFLFLVGQKILNPLKRLEDAALKIKKGEYGSEVDISVHNEIGDLANVFNEMSGSIKEKQSNETKLKKFEVVEQLVRSVNHEINNPLMIISGNAEFLGLALNNTNDSIKEKINAILQQVSRISQIMQKLREIRELVTENYTSENDKMIDLAKSSTALTKDDLIQ